jgi:hypothetical protein
MPAYRLLDQQGRVIGTVTIDRPEFEAEIVNGQPELGLGYTCTQRNILNFFLVVVPPPLEGSKIKPWLR